MKRGDTAVIEDLTEPVAVLKCYSVKSYLIPQKLIAYFMDIVEDVELAKLTNKRLKNSKNFTIVMNINES